MAFREDSMSEPAITCNQGAAADNSRSCDVLVVGAGPAGSMAALAAVQAGARVIMIDRRSVAGYPPRCAGFIPMPVFQRLEISSHVIAQKVDRMETHFPSGVEESRSFGYIVHRDSFDQLLAQKAEDAGAELLTGHRAVGRVNGSVIVKNSVTSFKIDAGVIIGADGPLSAVGRWIGSINQDMVRAAQWRVPLKLETTVTRVFFDQKFQGGYGWLFPLGDSALVGLALSRDSTTRPAVALRSFATQLQTEGLIEARKLVSTGGLIPIGGPLRCRKGDVLLAGDAAGHCNPVTGAGIATAMFSGELAGSAAAACAIHGDVEPLRDYEIEIEDTYAATLRHAYKRRQELLASWHGDDGEFVAALRRSWIAFPGYACL
jgi:geranylgeranyl reductase family protein